MSRYTDRERYFNELAQTSETYFTDYILRFKGLGAGTRVLEIGCGEGGNLVPFAKAGCSVCGLDLAGGKIANADWFFQAQGLSGVFLCADFLTATELKGGFDLILIHDVIEHIEPEYKSLFFRRAKDLLSSDGIVFWGFPAWQMPFGGHQQICRSKVCSKLPFMHLLPAGIYKRYLQLFGESEACINELMSIKKSKMTIESFERLCAAEGYDVLDRKLWFINPHYQVKFNLKPRVLWGWLGNIPWLRNFFTTGCFFITSKSK